MNTHDNLSKLLQSWQTEAPEPQDFNRGVWMRLESAESRNGAVAFFNWIALFSRPRIAVAAVAIALFGGVFLGSLQARSGDEDQYLRSLNPYSAQSHHR
jgi:hypothetical protein